MIGLCSLIVSMQGAFAQEKQANPSTTSRTNTEQEIIRLSKDKRTWMVERKLDFLEALFRENVASVHMGGTSSRSQELGVIKKGGVHYQQADTLRVSGQITGTTAIVLNRIRC